MMGRAGCAMTRQIWSLLDIMRKFDAWGLAMLLHHIDKNRNVLGKLCEFNRDEKLSDEDMKLFITPIVMLAQHYAEAAKLDSTYDRVWDGGPFCMASKIGMTFQQAENELTVLRQCIEADLEKRSFISVLPPKDGCLFSLESDWGSIWEAFPSTRYDSEQAISCYALDLDTACVFHLMRVAEYGLRGLARRMKIKLPKKQRLEWAQWRPILKAMADKTETLFLQMKAGPAKDELLEFYNGALGQFYGFKDEYRNHVMHTRGTYDEFQASSVIAHVKDFMCKLALRIDEKGRKIRE